MRMDGSWAVDQTGVQAGTILVSRNIFCFAKPRKVYQDDPAYRPPGIGGGKFTYSYLQCLGLVLSALVLSIDAKLARISLLLG